MELLEQLSETEERAGALRKSLAAEFRRITEENERLRLRLDAAEKDACSSAAGADGEVKSKKSKKKNKKKRDRRAALRERLSIPATVGEEDLLDAAVDELERRLTAALEAKERAESALQCADAANANEPEAAERVASHIESAAKPSAPAPAPAAAAAPAVASSPMQSPDASAAAQALAAAPGGSSAERTALASGGRAALREHHAQVRQRCAHCGVGGQIKKLSNCSRCKMVWYCCGDHQKLDWTNRHKTRCPAMKAMREDDELNKESDGAIRTSAPAVMPSFQFCFAREHAADASCYCCHRCCW